MDFRNLKEFLKDASVYILVIIFVLFVVNYVFTFQQNVGPSMSPTLENGDAFILNKLAYKVGKIKRGNVVVINNNNSKYLVKRIIGLPGEKVEFKDNVLYINGVAYKEDYLGSDVETYDFTMNDIKGATGGKIPDKHYLVLGDNRTNSSDSREFGLVWEKEIVGRTTIRIWPLNKFGLVG